MTKIQHPRTKVFGVLQRLILVVVPLLLMGATLQEDELKTMHDPTEPPASMQPVKGTESSYRSLNLTAIFVKPNSRSAIINNQTYHEGDAIGEYIITNIDIDAVELIDSANNREIVHLATPVKKASPTKEE